MSRVKAFDAFFLLTESRRSPWHMAGCEVFEIPEEVDAKTFIDKIEAGMRKQQPVSPFDQVVDYSKLWPRWKTADVDVDYHLTRQVLPSPGNQLQFMAALEHFCSSTLDHNLPLWEAAIIEGLEGNRFAIAFKVHHALVDGQGGLKIILRALSTRASEKKVRALWGDNHMEAKKARRGKPGPAPAKPRQPQSPFWDSLKPGRGNWRQQFDDLKLFRAAPSALNKRPASSARRFGIGDLPLEQVRDVARSSGTSVNDVLLCLVDAAVHRYLKEHGQAPDTSLVAGMPVSTRKEGVEGGNQAGLLTIELGHGDHSELERLEIISANTGRAKTYLQQLPAGFLITYGVAVLGMPLLLQNIPGFIEKRPVINLGVSNVSPPKGSNYLEKPLYLAGAKLVGMYTQPILPPAVLLNVTAASMKGKLCLGIGSTREAIEEPLLLMDYIAHALDNLTAQLG